MLSLLLALALAAFGASSVALPGAATVASAEEASAAADEQAQATLTVIAPDADGNPTYILAPWTADITDGESGWEFTTSVLDEAGIAYEASDSQFGKFVTSIAGTENAADYSKSWLLYVNGEASSVGISSVELKAGDTLTWYYGSYTVDGDNYVAPSLPAADTISEDSVPMYRLYNQWSGEHLFTEDADEVSALVALGWQDEGTEWKAATSSSTPVYRLYNQYSGDHLYTTDADEYASLQTVGWTGEGVKAYSDGAEGVAVYRLFNPYVTIGTHLYTTDKAEYDQLSTIGWQGEDVALYGVR